MFHCARLTILKILREEYTSAATWSFSSTEGPDIDSKTTIQLVTNDSKTVESQANSLQFVTDDDKTVESQVKALEDVYEDIILVTFERTELNINIQKGRVLFELRSQVSKLSKSEWGVGLLVS